MKVRTIPTSTIDCPLSITRSNFLEALGSSEAKLVFAAGDVGGLLRISGRVWIRNPTINVSMRLSMFAHPFYDAWSDRTAAVLRKNMSRLDTIWATKTLGQSTWSVSYNRLTNTVSDHLLVALCFMTTRDLFFLTTFRGASENSTMYAVVLRDSFRKEC